MNKDPFDLDEPTLLAFSGGRTSGYLLRMVLDRMGSRVRPVFQNTGRERLETLDFVQACSERWDSPITWVEYRYDAPVPCPTRDPDYTSLPLAERVKRWDAWQEAMAPLRDDGAKGKHTFTEVNYQTASRHGQPFEEAIASRGWLPNRVARYCTAELKVKTGWRWAKAQGLERYTKAVGLRFDEPGRVQRLLGNAGEYRASEEIVCPLFDARVTLNDVMAFWASQPFDLHLRPEEGNCDLCFLKRKGTILSLMHERPDLAAWWIAQERNGKTFRSLKDRPRYAGLLKMADQPQLFDDEDDLPCACTD